MLWVRESPINILKRSISVKVTSTYLINMAVTGSLNSSNSGGRRS